MRVLVVARVKNGRYAPFITEQVDAIKHHGATCRFFGVDRRGIIGYVRQIPLLLKAIKDFNPDIIHAHYGLCGLLANLQRRIPVVTTYHGSDINNPRVLWLSKRSIYYSKFNVFVSQENINIAKPRKNFALIPCGINLDDYPIIGKEDARKLMGMDMLKKYVLFAGAFDNPVKNAPLAMCAMSFVPDAELLELKGYSRKQVATLMYAVDVLLMTSFSEGSPQVVKEALVCGCPIVSVDVGDVKKLLLGISGCSIVERNAVVIAEQLSKSFGFPGRTEGRRRIEETQLSNEIIALKLIEVYKTVMR